MNLNKFVQSFKQDKEKEEGQNGSWSELPQDILCVVSARLLVSDLSAFRAVCKSWLSSIPVSRPLLPLVDSPYSQSPCLILLNNHTCRFFHPIKNATYQMNMPELRGAHIRFSKYGWLLLSRKDCSIFFFHPFNRIKIELPRYPIEDAFETICFSSPPDSIDCFVFGITFNGGKFGIIRRGEAYWTIREFIGEFAHGISNCNPLLYKGRCYCLGGAGQVGVFDLQKYMKAQDTNNEYSCQWTYLPSILPKTLHDLLHKSYLVESAKELLAIFELHDHEPSIYIFALNLCSIGRNRKRWRLERNMENKLLYVSSGGSFSILTVIEGMGNMIFMPTVEGNSNVFYSLRTKKYHYFCKDHSFRTLSHTNEHINCTWINPMRIDLDEAFEW